MEFVRGTFQTFESQTTVHLGRLERNLSKGDLVEFDGYTLKFAGKETVMPELKAGIKRGWLKHTTSSASSEPVEVVVEAPAPPKKEMKIETVYDEERAVAEINPTKKQEKKKFPVVVESQDDDMITVSKVQNKSGATVTSASSAETSGGIAESQGAESVGQIKIKTASKQKTVISDGSQASSEISRLENLSRDAVKSETQEEEASVAEIATEINDQIEEVDGDELDLTDLLDGEEEEAEPAPSPIDEQAVEAAQILAAVDGEVQPTQGAVTVGKDTSKVKSLPVGIDWDMSPHWTKRASLAVELYRDHPEILEAIMAVESKGVIKAINKALEG